MLRVHDDRMAVATVDSPAVFVLLVVISFFVETCFAAEAERFRLLVPLVDFDLLDDGAFFVLVVDLFLLGSDVFD